MSMRMWFVPALMAAAALSTGPTLASKRDGNRQPGQAVQAALGGHMTPRVQSEVMVLGSWHLGEFKDWLEPGHLDEPVAMLERFNPTRIAIERLPPDEIALLAEHEQHDPAAGRVIDMFARQQLDLGRTMQQALETDRIAAQRRAAGLLDKAGRDMDRDERVELVAHLLAAYEFDSAALQWSYLQDEARAQARLLPEAVRQALDKRLQSADEIVTVGMRLARSLGLQRLYPVDSQYEVIRTLSFPEQVVDEVFAAANGTWRESDGNRRFQAARARAHEEKDLAALFRYANAYETQVSDTGQWTSWTTLQHPSGLHRFRYAMWELRNQRMATHVMDVAASTEPERVLFIVGYSHKAYVEGALDPQLTIRLVQPKDYGP